MINVGNKPETLRIARAEGYLKVSERVLMAIKEGSLKKGEPFEASKIAGIMAIKNTANIIPYCHPVPVVWADVKFRIEGNIIISEVEVSAMYHTGVEMEALIGAAVASLTLYDMLKPLKEEMEITGIKLLSKKGGISNFREEELQKTLSACVLVTSDSVAGGKKEDKSGKLIVEKLKKEGLKIFDYKIVPDDRETIEKEIIQWIDSGVDLVITTGGTGLGPRDVTSEVTKKIVEKEVPGIAEAMRAYGQKRTQWAMLSRAFAGIKNKTLVINLPGSSKGVEQSLEAILPGIFHIFPMMRGGRHNDFSKRSN